MVSAQHIDICNIKDLVNAKGILHLMFERAMEEGRTPTHSADFFYCDRATQSRTG